MDVKAVIKKKGFTIEQVANSIGITRITLSQNLSRNPTINTLQKIADVIGCKVGDFFLDEILEREEQNFRSCPYCGKKIRISTTIEKEE